MMTGVVTARLEAVLNVCVKGPDGQPQTLAAVIDTGFSGFITLPPELIAQMGLPFAGTESLVLADGNEALFRVFDIVVQWNEQPLLVRAHEANTDALIGTALLHGSCLTTEFLEGGSVRLEAMER
jgi:clan AA aspartic protease